MLPLNEIKRSPLTLQELPAFWHVEKLIWFSSQSSIPAELVMAVHKQRRQR